MKKPLASFVLVGALLGAMAASAQSRLPFGSPVDARTPQILYHGGPILLGSVRIYIIYYGSFQSGTVNIVNDFFSNLGATPQFDVNTTYYDGQGNFISGNLTFSPASNVYFDNYSEGKFVTSNVVLKIIHNALANGHLPTDTGGEYFLITSPDVRVLGFCSSFCAYHNNSTSIISGQDIKYALVPDPSSACYGCDGNVSVFNQNITPNGDIGADEMTDSIMHELSETVTDPDINAWYTRAGAENGDLCNFNYGTTYIAPNGAYANAHMGNRDYLIQTIWENKSGGFCANVLQ
jgi:hypothetical protein